MSKMTLAQFAMAVESVCSAIDACDGELTPELLAQFAETTADLAVKTDNWLGYLDALKSRLALLKEHKERVGRAIKTAENLDKRLKDYIRHVMLLTPGVPLKGTTGSLYLHKNPKSVKYDFEFSDKTVYRTIDASLLALEPTLNKYLKEIKFLVLDAEKIKADLEAGMQIPWARIDTESTYVRIRG